jgi:hypothetical protein
MPQTATKPEACINGTILSIGGKRIENAALPPGNPGDYTWTRAMRNVLCGRLA